VGAWLFDGSTGWSEARLEGKYVEAGILNRNILNIQRIEWERQRREERE
jgi:hypothetical protein